MVTAEQLRELYYADPFTPFVLIFDDGRCVRISDPSHVMYSAKARMLAFPHGEAIGQASFDRVVEIKREKRPFASSSKGVVNMKLAEIREFQQARPFQPFAIHLVDTRHFEVMHPDGISLSPNGRSISDLNREHLIEVIDALLIVSLRPLKIAQSKPKR